MFSRNCIARASASGRLRLMTRMPVWLAIFTMWPALPERGPHSDGCSAPSSLQTITNWAGELRFLPRTKRGFFARMAFGTFGMESRSGANRRANSMHSSLENCEADSFWLKFLNGKCSSAFCVVLVTTSSMPFRPPVRTIKPARSNAPTRRIAFSDASPVGVSFPEITT